MALERTSLEIADVSKILGHSKWSITSDFYRHLSVEAQAVSMDKLGQALLGNGQ
jgi:hypothetical protein